MILLKRFGLHIAHTEIMRCGRDCQES